MEASITCLQPNRQSAHEAPPTARLKPEPKAEDRGAALRRVLYHDFEEAKHYLRYFQDGDPIALSDALVRREGAPLFVIARERAMAALGILSQVPEGPQRIEFSFDRKQQHLWAVYSGDLVSDILLYLTFREVQLRQGTDSYSAGELPAGQYTVWARFDGKPLAPAGAVTVAAGGVVTVNCMAGFTRCNPVQPFLKSPGSSP